MQIILQEFGLRVVSAGLHLLAERHYVGWRFQIEVLVAPHLAGGSAAGLHLVDQITRVVLFTKVHNNTIINKVNFGIMRDSHDPDKNYSKNRKVLYVTSYFCHSKVGPVHVCTLIEYYESLMLALTNIIG